MPGDCGNEFQWNISGMQFGDLELGNTFFFRQDIITWIIIWWPEKYLGRPSIKKKNKSSYFRVNLKRMKFELYTEPDLDQTWPGQQVPFQVLFEVPFEFPLQRSTSKSTSKSPSKSPLKYPFRSPSKSPLNTLLKTPWSTPQSPLQSTP